jgi:Group II intron, maturase-specific domain
LIAEINPILRGWENYYCKAHVRKLFAKLDRLDHATNLEPSHKAVAQQRLAKTTGTTALRRDGTGKLDSSYSFLATEQKLSLVKAGCGKSARPVWEADGG